MKGCVKVVVAALLGCALVVPVCRGLEASRAPAAEGRGLRGRSSGGGVNKRSSSQAQAEANADDSCEYANNGRCDVPYDALVSPGEDVCASFTDCSDCGDCDSGFTMWWKYGLIAVGILMVLVYLKDKLDGTQSSTAVAPEPAEPVEKWTAWQITVEDMSNGLGVDLWNADTHLVITGVHPGGGIAAFNAGHPDAVQPKDRIVSCDGVTGGEKILDALTTAKDAGLAATLGLEGVRMSKPKAEACESESTKASDADGARGQEELPEGFVDPRGTVVVAQAEACESESTKASDADGARGQEAEVA